MGGLIAHVDGKNFYVSCERIFNARLRQVPVVVLSNNDGCAIARSDEAKALGIKMGDAYHLNQREWARWKVNIRSSNYTLYGDLSNRMMRVFCDFSPEVEVYSIDEAFLGLTGFPDPEEHGRRIRAAVWDRVYLPVGVGIAPTKTLAKAANRMAKDPATGGVVLLDTEAKQTAALAKMVLGDVWGIGNRLQLHLAAIGITSPLELRAACPAMIRERFNVVVQRTVLELQGTPCLALELEEEPSQTICTSRSFCRAIESFEEMTEALTAYVSRAAEKMRQQGLATPRIHVMVTTNHHSPRDAQYIASREVRLTIATADTRRLIQAALWGLRGIYRDGFRYKKCGVVFLDLVPAAIVQGSLFLTPDSPRRQAAMAAMDKLNTRFGKDRVRFACSGLAEARDWWTKADFLSPRRTTRWEELLAV